MLINFKNKYKYKNFLEKLFIVSDYIKIGDYSDENGPRGELSYTLREIADETKYVRNFPMGHTGKIHIIKANQIAKEIFLRYDSFLQIGYDHEYEEGVDILFLDNKGRDVFSVIAHEKMCIIDERYKKVLST